MKEILPSSLQLVSRELSSWVLYVSALSLYWLQPLQHAETRNPYSATPLFSPKIDTVRRIVIVRNIWAHLDHVGIACQ